MARVINSVFTPDIWLHSNVIKEDGSMESKVFKAEGEVSNLRYVENKAIKTISGRIAGISYKFKNAKVKRYYSSIAKSKSWFKYDVVPDYLIIDDSLVKHAKLYQVPVREILEDELVTEVDHIENYLSYGFDATIDMSDGRTNTFSIREGQVITNVMFMAKGDEAIIPSAKVIAITYDSLLIPQTIVMNADGVLRTIQALQLISIEGVSDPISPQASLNGVIGNAPDGDTIVLESGIFNGSLNFTKNITLKGSKSGSSASKSSRDKKTFQNETILTGKITLSEGINVTLDGLVLTKDAVMDIGTSKEVTIKNCIVTDIVPPSNRDFIIRTGNGESLLTVDNCYFGAYNTESGRIYNLFEMNCKLKDGSSFTNNYFQQGCSVNNDICIYDVVEGSHITINGNVWENSANAIRVGVKGNPTCDVIISNNEYKATSENNDGEYAGLLLIQPYGKQTTGMKNVTVRLSNTKHSDRYHLYYLYAGKNDMAFNMYNLPTIYVNNTKVDPTEVYINATGIPVDKIPTYNVTTAEDANSKIEEAVTSGIPMELDINANMDFTESKESITVPSGADITLNIAENTEIKAVAESILVENGGKLTLTGNGSILSTTKSAKSSVKVDGGELTVDGVTIDAVKISGKADNCAYGIYASHDGVVNMASGTINTALGACIGTNNTTGKATINISGGELNNDGAYALYYGGQTVTNITGGKIQGINARMGSITIGGDAEIIPTTINDSNCDQIGENVNTSGCIWLGDTIAMVLGTYKANEEDNNKADLQLTIKDNAKVSSNYRSAIGIYKIDTKQAYTATVNVEKANSITTTDLDFKDIEVYDYDYIKAETTKAGKAYTPAINGDVTVVVEGEILDTNSVIDGDGEVDDEL